MDQFRRRAEDRGEESAQIILGRIDERLQNLTHKLDSHLEKYDDHVSQNDRDIRGLYKNQYIGYGIIISFNFIILFFKH